MNELTVYEAMQVDKIDEWKNEEPGIISQGIGALLSPIGKVINFVIPQSALEGALDACNSAGEFLADEGDVLRDGGVKTIEELRTKDLALSDQMANEVHNWAIGMASVEGGAMGFWGAPGIVADIPALMILSTRTIHKIGLCYGYEANTEEERRFVLSILSIVGSNSLQEKRAALAELAMIKNALKQTWKKIGEKANEKAFTEAFIILVRRVCEQLGINLTKRKAAQIVPIIGAGVAAAINGSYIKDVGYAAIRSYQERWLTDNEKWRDVN